MLNNTFLIGSQLGEIRDKYNAGRHGSKFELNEEEHCVHALPSPSIKSMKFDYSEFGF